MQAVHKHVAPLVPELVFVYTTPSAVSFEEEVANLFPGTRCTFSRVPFATRGAVETALAGMLQLSLPPATPLVFLDNDNVYPMELAAYASAPSGSFIGFDFDASTSQVFSFLRLASDGSIAEIVEKRRISDQICTGVWGFVSAEQFLCWGRHTLRYGPFPNNEIYMSSIFVNMIATGVSVVVTRVSVEQLGAVEEGARAALPDDRLLANALPNNKYNSLRAAEGRVVKRGPAAVMRGEVFFYEAVRGLAAAAAFPSFYGCTATRSTGGASATASPAEELEFTMEAIQGVPLTTLLRAQLLEEYHVDSILVTLRALHTCKDVPLTLDIEALRGSYASKLRARFSDTAVYGERADALAVLAALEAALARYTHASGVLTVAPLIHGDAWFANMLLTPTNELRLVDPRGLVGNDLTLNGDAHADFAKLAQSLLGFDEIVFGLPRVPHAYRARLTRAFAAALRAGGIEPAHVLTVCAVLVAGSLHAYTDARVRDGLWAFVQRLIDPASDNEWAELTSIFGVGIFGVSAGTGESPGKDAYSGPP